MQYIQVIIKNNFFTNAIKQTANSCYTKTITYSIISTAKTVTESISVKKHANIVATVAFMPVHHVTPLVKSHGRILGHAVAYWLRHYAINQKVAGSIPDEVIFLNLSNPSSHTRPWGLLSL
jgi:hypothetical protein